MYLEVEALLPAAGDLQVEVQFLGIKGCTSGEQVAGDRSGRFRRISGIGAVDQSDQGTDISGHPTEVSADDIYPLVFGLADSREGAEFAGKGERGRSE